MKTSRIKGALIGLAGAGALVVGPAVAVPPV